jgi:hypothetical protein
MGGWRVAGTSKLAIFAGSEDTMAGAAQKGANGNFKSNPEGKVAQARLIQVQRDIISSSLKMAKLSLSIVVSPSQPAVELRDLERSERELANRMQEVVNAFTHISESAACTQGTRIERAKLSDTGAEKLLSGLRSESFACRDEQEVAGYRQGADRPARWQVLSARGGYDLLRARVGKVQYQWRWKNKCAEGVIS